MCYSFPKKKERKMTLGVLGWTFSMMIIPQTIIAFVWYYKIYCNCMDKWLQSKDAQMMDDVVATSQTKDNDIELSNKIQPNTTPKMTASTAPNNLSPKGIKLDVSRSVEPSITSSKSLKSNQSGSVHEQILPLTSKLLVSLAILFSALYSYFLFIRTYYLSYSSINLYVLLYIVYRSVQCF